MRSVRFLVRALTAGTALLTVAAGAAVAQAAPAPAAGTEPVYDYTQAVRERVWVRTSVDSDADGAPDKVACDN